MGDSVLNVDKLFLIILKIIKQYMKWIETGDHGPRKML
jgi:hypothetical protein